MFNLKHTGLPLTHYRMVPADVATAIPAEFITYTERVLPFTSTGGGTHKIVPGEWISETNGSIKAEVVSVSITSGSFAGSDAVGTLRIKNQHGTFSAGNIFIGDYTSTNPVGYISANSKVDRSIYYFYAGMSAKGAIVNCLNGTALVSMDGGVPDQTALVGMTLVAGSSITLKGNQMVRNFNAIDYASGQNSVLNIDLYF